YDCQLSAIGVNSVSNGRRCSIASRRVVQALAYVSAAVVCRPTAPDDPGDIESALGRKNHDRYQHSVYVGPDWRGSIDHRLRPATSEASRSVRIAEREGLNHVVVG